MQRRKFILNLGLGSLGTAFFRQTRSFASLTNASPTLTQHGPALLHGKPDNLQITPADADVIAFAATFASKTLFTGGCIASKSGQGPFRTTHLLARITDVESYRSAVTATNSMTGGGMSIGNSICFNYQQTTYEIEGLLPDPFDQRVADIDASIRSDGTPMVYAHEALLYDPVAKWLTDPHRAFVNKTAILKRIHPTDGYPELSKGNLAIPCFHLQPSARDQADLTRLLGRGVSGQDQALEVTGAFLENLTLFSQVCTPQDLQTLCGTRLLRSATRLALGSDSQRVIPNFARLRPRFGADITDGALLHAIFQATEILNGTRRQAANLALGGGCNLETFLTMQDFQMIGKIKADKAFKVYR